jgi:hypothetical protein
LYLHPYHLQPHDDDDHGHSLTLPHRCQVVSVFPVRVVVVLARLVFYLHT